MENATIYGIETRKLFGYFLSQQKNLVQSKFRKTDVGYRTYDNTWKIFPQLFQITKTIKEKISCGYNDYCVITKEYIYQIVKNDEGRVQVRFSHMKEYKF